MMNSMVDMVFGCDDCALAPDDVDFSETDSDGLLVFGLTVDVPGPAGQDVLGSVGWLAQSASGLDVREVLFPQDLQPGQHRLVVWRVAPGIWSLRHGRLGEGRNAVLTQVLSHEAAATKVLPGHVTLAGEIRIRSTNGQPEVVYNLETAFSRQQLQAYRDVVAPSEEMPLVDLRRVKGSAPRH